MNFKERKQKILEYRDLFGCELLNIQEIKNSKTNKELKQHLNQHSNHLIECANDAVRDIEKFEKDIGF